MAHPFSDDVAKMLQDRGHDLQEFTEAESACISRTIKSGLDEGKEMDQAVAIAISECAPAKARPEASLSTHVDDLPGGKYRTIDNGDGTFDILDVPIMAELKKGEVGAPFDIDETWMLRALLVNKTREAEGHVAPLKIHHPEMGAERPKRAGFISLTRVGRIRTNGKVMAAMFADLRRIPADTFRKIQRVELPYRSVEASWDDFEIDATAILDSEVPFFRLPMLTVRAPEKASVNRLSDQVALAYCSAGSSAAVLYKFGNLEVDVSKKQAKLAGHDEDEDKDKDENKDDMQARMAKLEEQFAAMEEILKNLAQAQQKPEDEDEDKRKEEEEARAQADAAPAELAVKTVAKLAAAESRLSKIEHEREVEILIRDAKAALAAYHLTDTALDQIHAMAEIGKDKLADFVSFFKAEMPEETPENGDEFEAENVTLSGDAAKLAKDLGDTPEVKKRMADEAKRHEMYCKSTGSSMTLERWVKAQDARTQHEEATA